ncbi:hypothetical protein [Phaeovulum sp.]|uniref:hypothetical protein n=1 Tax=Phaeovulum sp. TaxID=2934796 RepID=UPI00356734B9
MAKAVLREHLEPVPSRMRPWCRLAIAIRAKGVVMTDIWMPRLAVRGVARRRLIRPCGTTAFFGFSSRPQLDAVPCA